MRYSASGSNIASSNAVRCVIIGTGRLEDNLETALRPEDSTPNGAGSPFAPTAGISDGSSILSWPSYSGTPRASSLRVSTIRANSWGNRVPMLHSRSLSYNSPSDASMFRGRNYTKSQFDSWLELPTAKDFRISTRPNSEPAI